jgi:hypothetical protein
MPDMSLFSIPVMPGFQAGTESVRKRGRFRSRCPETGWKSSEASVRFPQRSFSAWGTEAQGLVTTVLKMYGSPILLKKGGNGSKGFWPEEGDERQFTCAETSSKFIIDRG